MRDAVCHAVTDAILGAAGAGDIGRHFPDTDPAWKDVDSIELLRQRRRRSCATAGYSVVNVDVVVIAQKPKLAPHVDAIRGRPRRGARLRPVTGQREGQDKRGRRLDGRGRVDRRSCRGAIGPAGLTNKTRPTLRADETSIRAQSDGSASCGQCPDGAVQLAARARPRAARSSSASRIPTSSDRRASRSRRSSRIFAGWGSSGTKESRSEASTDRIVRPSGFTSIARMPSSCCRRARVSLLLFGGAARGRSSGGSRDGTAAEVRRPLPRHPARRGTPADRKRRAGGHSLSSPR